MALLDELRRRLGVLSGWPVALGAGVVGSALWLAQAAQSSPVAAPVFPSPDASLGAALGFWLHSSAHSLPLVLAVLFASLVAGATLAGLAVFGPAAFSTLLTRLNELGGAVPAVLVLMLWRTGGASATRVGFVVILSGLFAVEVAQLLSETGKRVERKALDRGGPGLLPRRALLEHAIHELRAQLATRAALVSSAVFGLDAGLSFVGLGLDGVGTWGAVIGAAAGSERVHGAVVALSLASSVATVVFAYRLLSWQPWREPVLELRTPLQLDGELEDSTHD